jgi:hypothetical protein
MAMCIAVRRRVVCSSLPLSSIGTVNVGLDQALGVYVNSKYPRVLAGVAGPGKGERGPDTCNGIYRPQGS